MGIRTLVARRWRWMAAAGALGAAVYAADYASLRLKIPPREPYGIVRVKRYYAVKLKNRNTEYLFDEPEEQACVNSLFPHSGDTPCWYLVRHKEQRIDINAGPAGPWINTP